MTSLERIWSKLEAGVWIRDTHDGFFYRCLYRPRIETGDNLPSTLFEAFTSTGDSLGDTIPIYKRYFIETWQHGICRIITRPPWAPEQYVVEAFEVLP